MEPEEEEEETRTSVSVTETSTSMGGGLTQPSMRSLSSTDMLAAADKVEEEVQACAEKWGPVSAATTLAWDSVNFYFYTADEQGTLRAFSLERIIDELDGESMLHGSKKDRRCSSNRKASAQTKKVKPGNVIPFIFGKKKDTAKSTAIYRWGIQAHRETIIYCKSTPYGILTSSTDNKVKMWHVTGTEVGSLLSCAAAGQRSALWDLKLDIDSIMQKEERH
jgi:hypothetical protein